jgi:hypothetical protein
MINWLWYMIWWMDDGAGDDASMPIPLNSQALRSSEFNAQQKELCGAARVLLRATNDLSIANSTTIINNTI